MNKTKLRYFLPALPLLLSFSVLKAQKEECAVCLDKFYMFDHILTIKKTKYYKEAYSETFKPFERNYQRIKESDELCGVG